MADPDRPEFDHVLFGVIRDIIVFGDSSDLPRGWDRLRRIFHPDSERGGDTTAVHTRFTTDDLDWWRTFAEGRIDVTEALTDLVVLASSLPRQPVSYLTPVAHGLVAEYLEQQAYLVSPDWPTYLVNIWVIATRLAEPEIRRAHETRTELDLAHPLRRIPRTDGRIVVQKDWNRRRPCPKASVAAVRQYRRIWPQLRQLTSYILQFQADRREKRRIAALGGGNLASIIPRMPASLKFQDCTTTQRDYLLDCLAGADAARQEAITTATAEKHALAWSRWTEFLQLIGVGDDVFLDNMSPRERTVILGAFAHAVRQASFSGAKFSRLAASTVRDTVSYVCSSFRHHQRRDTGKDDIGQPSFLLQRQFRGYSQSDPAERPEKAITCRLLREVASVKETEEDRAVGQLAVGAFFFAMRSCEYSGVSGERRTKLLRLRNIQFYRGRRRMHHNDRSLLSADSVSITFEFQKNDERDVTITQHCTHDATLCPVRAWAALVKRVLGYPSTNSDTPVNAFVINGVLKYIPATRIIDKIRASATVIGEDVLGCRPSEFGSHSIRSGAAMAMYLNDVPTYTIMLVGRWSSDAFLKYIRRQVQEFTSGVSTRMIQRGSFFNVPHAHSTSHREDPRTPNCRQSFAGINSIGRNAGLGTTMPSFALFT